jgi:HK97 gp10 family phage protein
VSVDLDALNDYIGALEEDVRAAARPAAQAGAEVLYQAVMQNVNALGRQSGNLASSIYQAYSTHDSKDGKHVYHVSWNPRKAPHAHLVEFGHIQKFKVYLGKDGRWYTNKKAPLPSPIQRAAKPFMRSAMAQFPRAQAAMEERFFQELGHVL